jgi:hypothetical protein
MSVKLGMLLGEGPYVCPGAGGVVDTRPGYEVGDVRSGGGLTRVVEGEAEALVPKGRTCDLGATCDFGSRKVSDSAAVGVSESGAPYLAAGAKLAIAKSNISSPELHDLAVIDVDI